MNKTIKITQEERKILRDAESGKYSPSKNKNLKDYYSKIAKKTLRKDKMISIRISGIDLMKIKTKAIQEGLPYQVLISSSLHKLIS